MLDPKHAVFHFSYIFEGREFEPLMVLLETLGNAI